MLTHVWMKAGLRVVETVVVTGLGTLARSGEYSEHGQFSFPALVQLTFSL